MASLFSLASRDVLVRYLGASHRYHAPRTQVDIVRMKVAGYEGKPGGRLIGVAIRAARDATRASGKSHAELLASASCRALLLG
jgi:hypothetical protein